MARYDKRAQKFVEKEMHKQKHEHRFKNSKQAVAVGLDEARRAGVKVPKKK